MSMIRNSLHVAALLCGMMLCGCGGGANIPEESVTPPPPTPAKQMLTDIANSGEVGSGASMIRDALESMKATDAPKAEELLKDLTELEGLGDPAKIKAKAKAMADKL
jgi:hypothetical protein